jgi:hypothetical protein
VVHVSQGPQNSGVEKKTNCIVLGRVNCNPSDRLAKLLLLWNSKHLNTDSPSHTSRRRAPLIPKDDAFLLHGLPIPYQVDRVKWAPIRVHICAEHCAVDRSCKPSFWPIHLLNDPPFDARINRPNRRMIGSAQNCFKRGSVEVAVNSHYVGASPFNHQSSPLHLSL